MDQLPNLGREQEMLDSMGLKSIDDLFSDIPEDVRRIDLLPLREPQSEEEIWADAQHLLGANIDLDSRPSFPFCWSGSKLLFQLWCLCSQLVESSDLLHTLPARGQPRNATGYVGIPDDGIRISWIACVKRLDV